MPFAGTRLSFVARDGVRGCFQVVHDIRCLPPDNQLYAERVSAATAKKLQRCSGLNRSLFAAAVLLGGEVSRENLSFSSENRIIGRKTGSVPLLILAGTLGFADPLPAAPTNQPPPPNLCDTPDHHQFDFWVGKWDVYRADTNQLVAHSLIEKLYAGCAVRENWMPLQGTGGGSLNAYRPRSHDWRQVWTDSANSLNEYAGRRTGKMMVLTGTASSTTGDVTRVRTTYQRLADGSVVQSGFGSADGKRWALRYRFVYRRAPQQ